MADITQSVGKESYPQRKHTIMALSSGGQRRE